jgi:hypothetical protein
MRVNNGIPLGWPLPLTGTTANSVQTLKAPRSSYDNVLRVMTEDLGGMADHYSDGTGAGDAECAGSVVDKLFAEFEVEPIASASLAQVHRVRCSSLSSSQQPLATSGPIWPGALGSGTSGKGGIFSPLPCHATQATLH